MAKKLATRTRYLLVCPDDDALRKLEGVFRKLSAAPELVSSTALKGSPLGEAAVVNKHIRIISAPLTDAHLKKIKDSKSCRPERDVLAFTCPLDPTTVEAAIRESPLPWGIKKIDADIVWERTKGKGVKVAVLDTGIDKTHQNLKKHVKKGVSFVENVLSANDDNGHGTHCAGIIAAYVTNGDGIYGVAPEASIYPVKIMNYNGSGLISTVVLGLQWCLDNRMDVVSMSFRVPSDLPQSLALKQACEILWDKGLLLVAAVGNDREDKRPKALSVGFPARLDCVLGVGATDQYDTIAAFSNIGKGVDVVAPGVGILSTYRNHRFREMSGTSQACPHVAGVAALLKSFRSSLTNTEIKKVILETADPLGSDASDVIYGRGLVNATGAIEQLDTIVG